MPKVIDLHRAGDPRDVIHQAVHRLAEGQLVGFPTETLYVGGAHALQPQAVSRLRSAEAAGSEAPLTLALKNAQELLDYVPDLCTLGQKLARRCWPGPVVLALDAPAQESLLDALPEGTRATVVAGGEVRFRVVAHDVVQEVLRLMPAPMVLSGEHSLPDRTTAGAAAEQFGQHVAVVLDDGPSRYGQPATVVRVHGDSWTITEPGVVTETMIRRLAGEVYLFVCTGNTCRSPMAEALFRRMLAERLGCSDDELADRGFIVLSAGLSATSGASASPEAVDLFQKRGIDLRAHASQPVTDRLIDQADHVFAMTRQHRDAILAARPDVADRVDLLARDACDISDPIGGSPRDYQECQQEIERHLRAIVKTIEIRNDHNPQSRTP